MKLIKILKNDIVLTASFVLAVASAFFVKPDIHYISYINMPVLVLLFCLMLVVAGLKKAGAFDVLTSLLSSRISSEKTMVFALCTICFFASALITNDVALITFVPFSIAILKNQNSSAIIFCVAMETISANLGSLLTPIGNPQKIFLYTHYGISVTEFFKITIPLGIICAVMITLCLLFKKNSPLKNSSSSEGSKTNKKELWICIGLFALCILSVLDIVSCYLTLLIICVFILAIDKTLFKEADYLLLITFVFFFIFAGNIARIPVVYDFIKSALSGREILISASASQLISNVPASMMLSSFTDDYRSLILGTNIGGLGTLIASMASLISYRFIANEKTLKNGKYILMFSLFNFLILFVLLVIYTI